MAAAPARAQAAWPQQPITMVHGFAAGGPIDIVARIVRRIPGDASRIERI
jgi:tripartite-type tricarboxylate transporter receptor subunit TctC